MEDIKRQLELLNSSVNNLQNALEQANANNTKIFTWIINKMVDIEAEMNKIKETYSVDMSNINAKLPSIEKLNNYIETFRQDFTNSNKSISEEYSSLEKQIIELESKCLSTQRYLLVDKTESPWLDFSRIRKFFYTLFHWRKLKEIERRNQEIIEASIKAETENKKLLEEKRRKEEEEAKINARNKMKNILNMNKE